MQKTLTLIAVAALAAAAPQFALAKAAANKGSDKMTACAAEWKAMPADKQKATTYKDFSKSCLSAKPAAAAKPMTPQEKMKDCAAQWKAMPAAKQKATTYKAFSATCLKG